MGISIESSIRNSLENSIWNEKNQNLIFKLQITELNLFKLQLKLAMTKMRAVETSKSQWSPLDFQQPFNPDNIKLQQSNEEMRAFDDFLLKRKIEEKRRDRVELSDFDSNIFDNDKKEEDEFDDFSHLEEEPYIEPFDDANSQETFR